MVKVEDKVQALKTQIYRVHRKLVVCKRNNICVKKAIWVWV